MAGVELEITIPVFKRAKAVHALDRTATVIGMEHGLGYFWLKAKVLWECPATGYLDATGLSYLQTNAEMDPKFQIVIEQYYWSLRRNN
jgi:hypothetical protein